MVRGVVKRPHISAGTGQELAPVVSEDDSSDGRRKVPVNKFPTILVRDVLVRYISPSAPTFQTKVRRISKDHDCPLQESQLPVFGESGDIESH